MLSLKELAIKIGAEYRGSDIPVPYFSIDSRTLQKGEVFVALRAERDGHEFVNNAIKAGASGIVVDHLMDVTVPQIIVKDTLKAFGQMAHVWRKQFDIPIVGLTGSCGKTTTKDMIASILSEKGLTLAPEGTFNNAYGVPLTLLKLRPEHKYAVIEMGTNSPGEIAYIAEITEPTIALITNIGASHLEKLVNFAGVSQEKSDIFKYMAPQGIAVLNQDEPFMKSWLPKIGDRHRLTYSVNAHADVFATNIHTKPDSVNFDLHTPIGVQAIVVSLPGNHIVVDAIAAAAVTLALGLDLEKIALGLGKMQGIHRRFKQYKLKNGCILIDDTYNSSINSVQNAINTLQNFKGRKVITLTNFGELGDHLVHYHEELGKWCSEAALDAVYLYGDKDLLAHTLKYYPQAHCYTDKDALTKALQKEVLPGATLLIKGLNSFNMYSIVQTLLKEYHA